MHSSSAGGRRQGLSGRGGRRLTGTSRSSALCATLKPRSLSTSISMSTARLRQQERECANKRERVRGGERDRKGGLGQGGECEDQDGRTNRAGPLCKLDGSSGPP